MNELPTADPTKTHSTALIRHGSPLVSCRFHPDGQHVFFAAQDSKLWRWEIESGKSVELTGGHQSWTNSLAFTPDKAVMISSGYDGKMIWWSECLGEKPAATRTVEAHSGWVRSVAISPDGALIASAGNDNLVKLWNSADGSLVREMSGHDSHVYNVTFHPDGKSLVSGDLNANLIHWETETGKESRRVTVKELSKFDTTFRAIIGGYRALGFSDDGKLLAGAGITNVSNAFAGVGNPGFAVIDWETGKQKTLHLSKGKLRGTGWGVAIHPQQFTIGLHGGSGGTLLFWKPGEANEFHTVKLPNTARCLDIATDRLHLATAHADGHLRLHKMAAKA